MSVKRLLVVDDEPRLLSFVSRAIDGAGYAVDCAESGEEALELMAVRSYDLVVLDLRLPGIDGLAVLRTLRLDGEPHPVIVLSARDDSDVKVACLELGAADYLTKPFTIAELLARVRARLREAGARARPEEAEDQIRVGNLTLDLRRRVADWGAGSVSLSGREFFLLQYLMRNDGKVCSRSEILSEVWGLSFDPGTNMVDVYVRRLRNKLPAELVETIRGVGYALNGSALAA